MLPAMENIRGAARRSVEDPLLRSEDPENGMGGLAVEEDAAEGSRPRR